MLWNTTETEQSQNYRSPSTMRDFYDDFAALDSFEDKENAHYESPKNKYESDVSLYDSNSPARMSCSGSPEQNSFTLRRPSDDQHDHNSLDSGYSAHDSGNIFSPKGRVFSFGSQTSMDEAFLDISEIESEEEVPRLPGDFNQLISGSLVLSEMVASPKAGPSIPRPPFRRALSLMNTPASRARSCLFKDDAEVRSFKRPEPPTDLQTPFNKRTKHEDRPIQGIPARVLYQRSVSANEDSIKMALQRSSTDPDLIGDFSKAFCLPLIPGRHQDLKSITPKTLAALINGDFTSAIASFKVIDCRYPYEFEGGHVVGAHNIYTKQQIIDELINAKLKAGISTDQRHILVFHCEFSSERGPNLYRYLRSVDRSYNKDYYPQLHYPEIYLLDGGYKQFYESFPDLCAPNGYLPMLHPDHEHSLRHFRAKSKTWNADKKCKPPLRSTSFKRF